MQLDSSTLFQIHCISIFLQPIVIVISYFGTDRSSVLL